MMISAIGVIILYQILSKILKNKNGKKNNVFIDPLLKNQYYIHIQQQVLINFNTFLYAYLQLEDRVKWEANIEYIQHSKFNSKVKYLNQDEPIDLRISIEQQKECIYLVELNSRQIQRVLQISLNSCQYNSFNVEIFGQYSSKDQFKQQKSLVNCLYFYILDQIQSEISKIGQFNQKEMRKYIPQYSSQKQQQNSVRPSINQSSSQNNTEQKIRLLNKQESEKLVEKNQIKIQSEVQAQSEEKLINKDKNSLTQNQQTDNQSEQNQSQENKQTIENQKENQLKENEEQKNQEQEQQEQQQIENQQQQQLQQEQENQQQQLQQEQENQQQEQKQLQQAGDIFSSVDFDSLDSQQQKFFKILKDAKQQLESLYELNEANGWKLESKKNDYSYYSKEQGEDVYLRAEDTFNCSMQYLADFSSDYSIKSKYDDLFHSGEIIKELSPPGIMLLRQQTKSQMMVSGRDFIIINIKAESADRIVIVGISVSDFDEQYPAKKGVVRGWINIAGWVIDKISESQCKGCFIVSSDPKGKIPKSIKKVALGKQADSIKKLSKLIEKQK